MKKVANTMAPITAPLSLVLAIGMRLILGLPLISIIQFLFIGLNY